AGNDVASFKRELTTEHPDLRKNRPAREHHRLLQTRRPGGVLKYRRTIGLAALIISSFDIGDRRRRAARQRYRDVVASQGFSNDDPKRFVTDNQAGVARLDHGCKPLGKRSRRELVTGKRVDGGNAAC